MFKISYAKLSAACGSALIMAIAVVTLHSITASVSRDAGLSGISITPSKDVTVSVGESLMFTVEGDYGTNTMPVRSDWSLSDTTAGTLGGCKGAKKCTFTAGKLEGKTSIKAVAGSHSDSVTIMVKAKEEVLTNPFKDELPEWAFGPVVKMFKKLIVKGYDDGRYGPGDSVTNGQVITLLHRILKHAKLVKEPGSCDQVYKDVPHKHYAFKPVCLFSQQGWSTSNSNFNPDSPASRGAMAGFINSVVGETILSAMGSRPSSGQAFDDVPLSHPNFNDTAVTNHTGIMTGYPNGDFGVDDDLNRAAAAVVMFRILNKIEDLNINTLKGYDSTATSSHGSAPEIVKAACMVNADHGGSPRADTSEVGDGFAKLYLMEDHDITSVRARCSGEFEKLIERYCADDRNKTNRFQRSVLIYSDDGSIKTGGGASRVSVYEECETDESSASSVSLVPKLVEQDLCVNITCSDNKKCSEGFCVYKTCSDFGGLSCKEGQICNGKTRWSSGEENCCIGTCDEPIADVKPISTNVGNISLKGTWSYFDASVQKSGYGIRSDVAISYEPQYGQIGVSRNFAKGKTKISRPASEKTYKTTTFLDCLNSDFAKNYSTIMLKKLDDVVCFLADDGYIGKVGNATLAYKQVHYTVWEQ